MTRNRTLCNPVYWVVLAAALPVAASGQDANDIDEIIVTATRIEKSFNQVPAAISVIGQDAIQKGSRQLSMDEPLRQVPGVFVQNEYNYAQGVRVSIRGFGARGNFGIRGLKILVDGIPETLPDGQGNMNSIDLGSTAQIEVLRGPSSSIWGNASGGVISVTTERAPAEPFTEVRALGGQYNLWKAQVKTGAQRDRYGYLVSLSGSNFDGYREHSRAEKRQLTGRFNFDLDNERELSMVVNFTDQPVTEDAGGLTAEQAASDPRSARDANIIFDAGETVRQIRTGGLYKMTVGDDDKLAVRGYYVTRQVENFLPFVSGGNIDLDRTFIGGGVSYTLNHTLGGRANALIIGLDVDRQNDDRKRYENNMGTRGALTLDQNELVRSIGLFAQNDLILSDRVTLSFGARLDDVKFNVDDKFMDDGDDSGVVSLNDVSPMLGIAVDLSDNLDVYANYSSAFETPTTTEFNRPDGGGGFNDKLKPQIARNLEVGLRGAAGDRSWYEVALFKIKVDDELIPFEVPGSPGRNYYANAGKSTRNGIEFSFRSNLTERASATFSYTYANYKFDEFIDDAGNDYAGNTIPGTPKSVLFGELRYDHPHGWFASADVTYIGKQFTNNANSVVSDAYTLTNLNAGWEHVARSLTIAPFAGINNLFDETYIDNVRINAVGGRYFEPGPGRTIYAGVRLRFE